MQKRNATCAVIGAGDYIGGEIAKKFAAEGFTVFAGRRDGTKLEPLVKEIEAAGGSIVARTLDARKEDEVAAFLNDADAHAPLEVCIFNVGANDGARAGAEKHPRRASDHRFRCRHRLGARAPRTALGQGSAR